MQKAKNRRPLPGGGAPLNATRSARADVALDEIGVDRSGEARVVQLQADEFASALLVRAQPAPISTLPTNAGKSGCDSPRFSAGVIVTLALRPMVWIVPPKPFDGSVGALGRRCGEA